MQTIRTILDLRKVEVRRLKRRGYEIAYIETQHLDTGEETTIVWTRSARPDDLAENEIPF